MKFENIIENMKFWTLGLLGSWVALLHAAELDVACSEGHTLDLNNICIEPKIYIEGCEKFASPSSCSKCLDGFEVKDGLCQPLPH